MLKAADERIASLRDLLDQIPVEQQAQSFTGRRLQEAITQRATIEASSDEEIATLLVARDEAARQAMSAPPMNRAGLDAFSPATKPAYRGLEAQLIFPGSISQRTPAARVHPPVGCELIALRGADGTRIAALFGRNTSFGDAGPRPALLYFYGNGTCMAESLGIFNTLRGLGFNVIMSDYEGYGMSDGSPSEGGCYAAADAAYDCLLKRTDIERDRIVAVGWSLGGAVAIDLASRRTVAGLATFSAFTSISDMGQSIAKGLPLAMLLSSRFDNLAKIGSIPCPIFMAHGSNDPLVPPEMMGRLDAAAKSRVTVVRVNGAEHNDIFARGGESLFSRLRAFVNDLPPISPATMP